MLHGGCSALEHSDELTMVCVVDLGSEKLRIRSEWWLSGRDVDILECI
jgi:hypothetical protein